MLSKSDQRCVAFAMLAGECGFKAFELAKLCKLVREAVAAGTRECNVPNYSGAAHRRRVEAHAKTMGIRVDWPGLYPDLYWGKVNIRLPL